MLLTVFLSIVFCAAISLMLLSAVAFIQDIISTLCFIVTTAKL